MIMQTETEKQNTERSGKRFRLIVRSAEEAVRVIRDKLGDDARVLSVRQVGGEGLKRFISSPKLEVIAEVPSDNENESSSEMQLDDDRIVDTSSETDQKTILPSNNTDSSEDQKDEKANHSLEVNSESENVRILSKAGFDPYLLREIQMWPTWKDIENKPLADALKEITIGLTDRFRAVNSQPATEKIALIGAPGVGKTTTLCKLLAHEVFMNKNVPNVLKVENGNPNPDDALRIFCEVIGVTLFRESDSLPPASENNPLYLDFPGLSLSNLDDWVKTKDVLDELDVQTRVLVLHGSYDREILLRNIRSSKHLGATHFAITHFDELTNSTKLWPIIMRGELSPFCVCNGQNVTGDFSTNILNQLISRTFPEELYARGFTSYQRR